MKKYYSNNNKKKGIKMNKNNSSISNNDISSLDIKSLHTQLIIFPNESNNHTCICSATLETSDGKKFTDLGESTHNHLTAASTDQLITMAADHAKSRVLFTASHMPAIPCRSDAIDTTCSQIDSTGADNLPSSEHRILPQVIDKNTLKGGGNKPITEKQKKLIETKSKKKGLSGNESSQKIINKNIDELTGAEADLVIKSIL